MQRWSDRPAPTQDPIDRIAAFSAALVKRYSAPLTKFALPSTGFALLLIYFFANRFYPSFDLLQFSSLLLGAGLIGIVVVGGLLLSLLIPGQWIFHGFIEHAEVRRRITEWFGEDEQQRSAKVLWLVFLCFAGPYGLASLILSSILLLSAGRYLQALLGVPLPVVLLFGALLKRVIGLRWLDGLRYAIHAWAPVMILCGLCLFVTTGSAKLVNGLGNHSLQLVVFYLIPLVVCLLAAVCAMGCFASLNYALHFSLFFALLIAFYSGLLAGLPEWVVKQLGLGAYTAESIVLQSDYCEKSPPAPLKLDPGCSLNGAHVVWSLGDTLVVRLGSEQQTQVQIPSRYVKAIVRQHD